MNYGTRNRIKIYRPCKEIQNLFVPLQRNSQSIIPKLTKNYVRKDERTPQPDTD